MAKRIGRFLQILFGCHARPDRSFFFRGRQFPICARCTGELVGMLIGIFVAVCFGCLDFWVILFGFALIFMFIYFHRTCVHIAGWILKLFNDPQEVDRVMERFI